MKQKFIQKYLELEMALSDTEEMLKLLFSAIKYDEENDVKGSYSYLVGKIEKRKKKIDEFLGSLYTTLH